MFSFQIRNWTTYEALHLADSSETLHFDARKSRHARWKAFGLASSIGVSPKQVWDQNRNGVNANRCVRSSYFAGAVRAVRKAKVAVRRARFGIENLSFRSLVQSQLPPGPLDSKRQRVERPSPKSSGRRPIRVPIPPNVPPIGTRPTFRTRCEYRVWGSREVSADLRT